MYLPIVSFTETVEGFLKHIIAQYPNFCYTESYMVIENCSHSRGTQGGVEIGRLRLQQRRDRSCSKQRRAQEIAPTEASSSGDCAYRRTEGLCSHRDIVEEKMMNEKRTPTHCALPICTLGAPGHGKTTLTAAIAKVVARIGAIHTDGVNDFEAHPPLHHPIQEGVGITYRAIDYETSGKFYTQIDCETHLDVVKMLVSGSPAIQAAIWVVNAIEGVTPDSESHLRLANQMHLPTILSFLNTGGARKDDELLEICQMEMRELLNECGWGEATVPIIVGDARKALDYRGDRITSTQWQPIVELIFSMNRAMPAPVDTARLPLIMPIHEIIRETKESVSVRGKIVQGQLAVGQAVDIVGKGDRIKTRCIGIKENEVCVESEPDWLSVGQVLCTPKTVKSHSTFTAIIYLLTHQESGTHIPLIENDRPDIYLWGIDMPAYLKLPPARSLITPGTYTQGTLTLDLPLAMEVGTRFEVKKMGTRIGIGVVTGMA